MLGVKCNGYQPVLKRRPAVRELKIRPWGGGSRASATASTTPLYRVPPEAFVRDEIEERYF
jgi:hypothetical protein